MFIMPIVLAELTVPIIKEDDREIVADAQRDIRYFSELYQRHFDQLYRFLLIRVGNEADAQDLTAQTFLTAMERLDQYRPTGLFIGWLLGIARHKLADHFRGKKAEVGLDWAAKTAETDHFRLEEDLVERKLQIELVSRKLQIIAPDRAEAVSLRLFAGLDVAEIGRLMGKNEAAVRMLIHRGLHDLQAQLAPMEVLS